MTALNHTAGADVPLRYAAGSFVWSGSGLQPGQVTKGETTRRVVLHMGDCPMTYIPVYARWSPWLTLASLIGVLYIARDNWWIVPLITVFGTANFSWGQDEGRRIYDRDVT